MGLTGKTPITSSREPLTSNDALHPSSTLVGSEIKGGKKLRSDVIESSQTPSKFLPNSSTKKRSLAADLISPEEASRKKTTSRMDPDLILREAFIRIQSSDRCKAFFNHAVSRKFPEIFIDSKENGKRIANLGRDIINGLNRDRSLISSGQQPQGPTSWGRTFVYVPLVNQVKALNEFTVIQKHSPSMGLLSGIVAMGDVGQENRLKYVCIHSTPARLDLMFRFGLLGCEKNDVQAQNLHDMIPEESKSDAYSFALQNAVEFGSIPMIEYCLKNQARPISPDEGLSDYREESPIEIALEEGNRKIKTLLMSHIDRDKDIEEIRTLFLDQNRWGSPPKEILELIAQYDNLQSI